MKKLKEWIKKNRPLFIGICVLIGVIIVLTIVLVVVAKVNSNEDTPVTENNTTNTTEVEETKEEYIVYIDAPVSIRLTFSDEVVTSCSMLDDTASTYFTEDDFVSHNLIVVLATVRNTLLQNNIDVSSIDITTNWYFDYTEDEIFQGILSSSEYDNDYTLNITYSYDVE